MAARAGCRLHAEEADGGEEQRHGDEHGGLRGDCLGYVVGYRPAEVEERAGRLCAGGEGARAELLVMTRSQWRTPRCTSGSVERHPGLAELGEQPRSTPTVSTRAPSHARPALTPA